MTCVVGMVVGPRVLLGADSAGVDGSLNLVVRKTPKVFRVGELVLGGTSSFRMLDVLEHHLEPPAHAAGEDARRYLVRDFVPHLRKVLKEHGILQTKENVDECGEFLVGIRGRLLNVQADFQVGEDSTPYNAVGCGAPYAMGAMHACTRASSRRRLEEGLRAAATFSAGVAPPFHFVSTAERFTVEA